MRIAIDIDGVLTVETEGFGEAAYLNRTPNQKMISYVNYLYARGEHIILFSSRFEVDRLITKTWLLKHGVKYHELILSKPQYNIIIDDKAFNPYPESTLTFSKEFDIYEKKM